MKEIINYIYNFNCKVGQYDSTYLRKLFNSHLIERKFTFSIYSIYIYMYVIKNILLQ